MNATTTDPVIYPITGIYRVCEPTARMLLKLAYERAGEYECTPSIQTALDLARNILNRTVQSSSAAHSAMYLTWQNIHWTVNINH